MKYFIFICLSFFVSNCSRNPTVAKVGKYSITKEDIAFRDAIIRIYYPSETRALGLDQLKKAYSYAQILINNGFPLDDKAILAEEERINKTTLMPEMLQTIKNVFHGNNEAYRRVYILPTLVERVIYYDFFLKDATIQAESQKQATKFMKGVKTEPQEFQTKAKKEGKLVSFTLTRHKGLEWENEKAERKNPNLPKVPAEIDLKMKKQREEAQKAEAGKWDEILKQLRLNEVYSKVVDFGEQWGVILPVKELPKKNGFAMRGALFAKASYADWMAAENKKVSQVMTP